MKPEFYPASTRSSFKTLVSKATLFFVFLTLVVLIPESNAQQGLVFRNPTIQSGLPGQNNTVYRFGNVANGVDALVKINGRSSSLVTLQSIDLTNTGWDKSWQPQVSYNGGNAPAGINDWWMEFTISFVNSINSTPVNVSKFDITALDIDGNGDRINEWVSTYGHSNYILENNSLLQYSSIWEILNLVNTVVGTKFSGPTTNYSNIDTGATRVMATTAYQNLNSMRIRTGGHSRGQNGAADRMYSFWFKGFTYQNGVQIGLPVTLKSFSAKLENKKPVVSWISSKEENLSAYVLERSIDGVDYKDAAMIFANGNTSSDSKYSYTDNAAPSTKGTVYYRLRMVDMDQKYKYSETRLVKMEEAGKALTISTYPNPAVNEIRITVPANWQDKKVQYDIFSVNGQSVKRFSRANANQTESIDISQLNPGSYIVKVSTESEHATQQFVKSK